MQLTQGNLKSIRVTQSSEIKGVDDCVTDAFVLAGPYPEPPELLVDNNVVDLPDFGFTLVSGPKMDMVGLTLRPAFGFRGF